MPQTFSSPWAGSSTGVSAVGLIPPAHEALEHSVQRWVAQRKTRLNRQIPQHDEIVAELARRQVGARIVRNVPARAADGVVAQTEYLTHLRVPVCLRPTE